MTSYFALIVGHRYRFRPPETNYPFDWTIAKRDKDGYIRCKLTRLYTQGHLAGRADVLVRLTDNGGFERPRWIEAKRLELIPDQKGA